MGPLWVTTTTRSPACFSAINSTPRRTRCWNCARVSPPPRGKSSPARRRPHSSPCLATTSSVVSPLQVPTFHSLQWGAKTGRKPNASATNSAVLNARERGLVWTAAIGFPYLRS